VRIRQLAADSNVLDVNSTYAYLLLSSHFAATSAVAEIGDALAGFVCAYRVPSDPQVLFVWQIGVDTRFRGRGIAHALLDSVTSRGGVQFLEASVTPSNRASRRLFEGFAERRGVDCREQTLFAQELFADGAHEPEQLLRIGPLQTGTPA